MKVNYTRLPGRSMGLASRTSLWLGPDHLLLVFETMTGEVYRRFFLRDIQAVTIRETRRQARWNLALVFLALLNLLPLLALASASPSARANAWWAAGSALWGVLALLNTLRGPTCETRIRTAVQDDVVAPLGRRRNARRVMAELRPRILAAQQAPTSEGVPT